MVLGTVRQEAGPHERWPKALKTKLLKESLGLSPLRSDGYCDDQTGGWTSSEVTIYSGERWKTTLESQGT